VFIYDLTKYLVLYYYPWCTTNTGFKNYKIRIMEGVTKNLDL